MNITIGITDTTSGYANYPLWIKGNDQNIEVVQLNREDGVKVRRCDGIVLSGGIDTHPKFYNNTKLDYTRAPDTFDIARDEFEMAVFRWALENNKPILAICRGMQLVNIALGGDLIQDIEDLGKNDHRNYGGIDGMHEIKVAAESLLYKITHQQRGVVNSAHHQALNRIADELVVTAYSADGIPEAAEWKDKQAKPFLLCVQWHPERLALVQPGSSFSQNVRTQFLQAVRESKNADQPRN